MSDPFFMWYVYVLYSTSSRKTYVGFTNDVERRLFEHVSKSKGFTLRHRPWIVIRTELYELKQEAIAREKVLKTGLGRDELKGYGIDYLKGTGGVSAAAEKD